MGRRTPLYDLHVEQGARMVDFGGWDMPVNYGSQIEEHHAVRRDAGIFDVSHMCVIDARGAARARVLLASCSPTTSPSSTTPGKALYSCMLNEAGGVIDDLIVYFLDESWFRVVVNAGTRDKDLAWMREHRAAVRRRAHRARRPRDARRAGPERARQGRGAAAGRTSRRGAGARGVLRPRASGDWFVARTGYTGEDGFEIMLPRRRGRARVARAQRAAA